MKNDSDEHDSLTLENNLAARRLNNVNTISGEGNFMRKRVSLQNNMENGDMENYGDRDSTVSQSLLSGHTLVFRRDTQMSDDLNVFSAR